MEGSSLEKATFAAGCFWCAEAAYKLLDGVVSVVSGYAGPKAEYENAPTYEQVSSGTTPYIEAVHVEYNPSKVSYDAFLKIFWEIHNPIEENKQGPDVGPQYQAVIFYHTEEQKRLAEQSKMVMQKAKNFTNGQIKTQIRPFVRFYPAEQEHKDYYEKHPNDPYSKQIIAPKLEKAKKITEKLQHG